MKALLRWFDSRMPSTREQWRIPASEYYAPKNWYISGPHFRDYYLLLDEQADHLFAMRLAAHIREARGISDEHADLATASLLEIWIDDTEKHVWYVFEGYPQWRGDG